MHITLWQQIKAHPILHLMEFSVATAMFALFGVTITLFRYNIATIPLAAVAGVIMVLSMAARERACRRKISAWTDAKGGGTTWRKSLRAGNKNYGRYTDLEIQQATLAVLTDPGFVLPMFFAKAREVVISMLQAFGLFLAFMFVIGIYTWSADPALIHADMMIWLHTGDPSVLNALLQGFARGGFIMTFFFLLTFGFWFSSGGSYLTQRVAGQLQAERRRKIYDRVCQEKLDIKIRYMPETLDRFELENLSGASASTLEEWHPGMLRELLQRTYPIHHG